MSAPSDKFGRPIVVVTGMGVVTSLGAGKEDNWRKLTAGESGIRTVTRFPIEGLKSTMAGTVDFVTVDPVTSTGIDRAAGRNGHRRSARTGRDRQQRPIFPDRCSWRWRRSRSNGRNGSNSDARSERPNSAMTTCCASAAAAGSQPTITVSCSVRWRAIWPKPSAPRARRFRSPRPAPPARPRSSSASRRSAAATRMRRCAWRPTARSIRKRWCGSRCCRRCRRRTIRRRPPQNRSRRTAMVS